MATQPPKIDREAVYGFPSDYAPTCPICGVRLMMDEDDDGFRVVDEDEDGPIWLGTCMEHGAFKVQVDDKDEE